MTCSAPIIATSWHIPKARQYKLRHSADCRIEPRNFWVYNNGVTILTHKIDREQEGKLIIHGCSVINGAQTTGALGTASAARARFAGTLLLSAE